MRIPPWIVGLALALWGWAANALQIAFPLIVLTLSPALVRRRFEFRDQEFHRTFEVCWVLLLGGLLLVYSREPMGSVLRSFAPWLPVVVFPAFMAQMWSTRRRLPVSGLLPFPAWRHQVSPAASFDLSPTFVALCLLSSSIAANGRPAFYPAAVTVTAAALWFTRVHGIRARAAATLLGVAAGGGWFAAVGIGEAQQWAEGRVISWVNRMRGDDPSARASRTAIGHTGRVGGSSRVVLHVRSLGEGAPPRRLRVATFTTWREGTWYAPRGEAEKVESENTGDDWRLDPRPGREAAVYIEWMPDRTGHSVPLPADTRLLAELAVDRLEKTALGSVRVETKSGMLGYRADHGPDAGWEAAPRDEDRLGVPPAEALAIRTIVDQLGIRGAPPAEALARLDRFFSASFRYTTELVDAPSSDLRALTPLGRFLLGSRAGHCEYFATAAVLLLREAGTAARYVTGYLLSGGERQGDTYTVRERQAHAWVRVWQDDRWQDFDPTPADSLAAEAAPTGLAQRLGRLWDDVSYALSRWWWLGEKRVLRQAYWLTAPLLAGLLWRLRRLRETPEPVSGPGAGPASPPSWPGLDSEWFAVEPVLAAGGWTRRLGEGAGPWRSRLALDGWPPPALELAARAHQLHEQLRFDPRGLGPGERDSLRRAARELLLADLPAPPAD